MGVRAGGSVYGRGMNVWVAECMGVCVYGVGGCMGGWVTVWVCVLRWVCVWVGVNVCMSGWVYG